MSNRPISVTFHSRLTNSKGSVSARRKHFWVRQDLAVWFHCIPRQKYKERSVPPSETHRSNDDRDSWCPKQDASKASTTTPKDLTSLSALCVSRSGLLGRRCLRGSCCQLYIGGEWVALSFPNPIPPFDLACDLSPVKQSCSNLIHNHELGVAAVFTKALLTDTARRSEILHC